jgi:hypothetical protein
MLCMPAYGSRSATSEYPAGSTARDPVKKEVLSGSSSSSACALPQSIRRRVASKLGWTVPQEGDSLNPRLVAMSGPLEGTAHTITDGSLSLGRAPCQPGHDRRVRSLVKQCAISQVTQGIYQTSDLDSHNGTFVNGIQVSHTPIQHGDRIRIGSSEFVFLIGQDEDASPQSSGAGKQTTSGTLTALFLDQRSGLPSVASGHRPDGTRPVGIFQNRKPRQLLPRP